MYQIFIKDSPEAKVTVYLDGRQPTNIPATVLAGIGNKEKRYEKHLESCFSDPKKSELLKFMVFLNKTGKEQGNLFLKCQCKFHKFHGRLVKEFLEKNKETLDTLQGFYERAEEGETTDTSIGGSRSGSAEEMIARGLITQEDMNFFIENINAQQSQEETGAKNNVEENH